MTRGDFSQTVLAGIPVWEDFVLRERTRVADPQAASYVRHEQHEACEKHNAPNELQPRLRDPDLPDPGVGLFGMIWAAIRKLTQK